jgi:aminopeptidase N
LNFLAAHDSDPFNRWQAVQTLATSLLVEHVAALRAGRAPRVDEGFLAAIAAILADDALEPAFVAQAITPPGESDIARELGRDVDPDAIFSARAALRATLGRRFGQALEANYHRLSDHGPYSPDAASAGRRVWKNACLDLMAATGDAGAIALAARQYGTADNMTDRMAALTTLSLHDVPERAAAIEDFYRRYQADPLVIDKWFALQATIPEAGTLDRVRALTAHANFSLANPNRVRALVGSFAQANQTQFNRADGAGYGFVVETVLVLDARNPQVAARLLAAFKSWRVLETGRRALAEAALRRVAAAASLSRDVRDIVERALAGD